jgi:hypothetical protein
VQALDTYCVLRALHIFNQPCHFRVYVALAWAGCRVGRLKPWRGIHTGRGRMSRDYIVHTIAIKHHKHNKSVGFTHRNNNGIFYCMVIGSRKIKPSMVLR